MARSVTSAARLRGCAEVGHSGVQEAFAAVVADLGGCCRAWGFRASRWSARQPRSAMKSTTSTSGCRLMIWRAPWCVARWCHGHLVAGDDVGVGRSTAPGARAGWCTSGDAGNGPQFGSGGVDFDAGVGGGERPSPVAEIGDTGGQVKVGAQVGLYHPQLAQGSWRSGCRWRRWPRARRRRARGCRGSASSWRRSRRTSSLRLRFGDARGCRARQFLDAYTLLVLVHVCFVDQ